MCIVLPLVAVENDSTMNASTSSANCFKRFLFCITLTFGLSGFLKRWCSGFSDAEIPTMTVIADLMLVGTIVLSLAIVRCVLIRVLAIRRSFNIIMITIVLCIFVLHLHDGYKDGIQYAHDHIPENAFYRWVKQLSRGNAIVLDYDGRKASQAIYGCSKLRALKKLVKCVVN